LRESTDWHKIKSWYPYISSLLDEFTNPNKELDLSGVKTLYRGSNFPESVILNDYSKLGTIFSWPSFTSTSRAKEEAEKFTLERPPDNFGVLFEIQFLDLSLIDMQQILDPSKNS